MSNTGELIFGKVYEDSRDKDFRDKVERYGSAVAKTELSSQHV